MKLNVHHIGRPISGEQVSGDAAVLRSDGGRTLFAIIDGLGHGVRAAVPATKAAEYLNRVDLKTALPALFEGLHRELKGTRGAVATVCVFDGARLEAAGVGNVELRSSGTRVPLYARPGVIGVNLPELTPLSCSLAPKDRIVLFSDGLSSRLSVEEVRKLPTQDACLQLLEKFSRGTDDATVLVADVEET